MRRARPNQVDKATRLLLEKITKAFETFETFSAPPQRFRVSIPRSDIVFNGESALELMYIEEKAVLHVVDIETGFNSATVGDAFAICWEILCIGFTTKMSVLQGSAFTLARWPNRGKAVKTEVQESSVEAYNLLGTGRRYHSLLGQIFHKIREEHLKMDMSTILMLSVKAMNDTKRPEGILPSYHVFGSTHRFTSTESTLPTQQQKWTLCKQLDVKWLLLLQNF